uniref:Uncharacterized protein n=1 Tax=Hyaloperonospora arabidopsidis (strain Emoy2) TaxID=559515 RepID=M4BW00_HYAAE
MSMVNFGTGGVVLDLHRIYQELKRGPNANRNYDDPIWTSMQHSLYRAAPPHNLVVEASFQVL